VKIVKKYKYNIINRVSEEEALNAFKENPRIDPASGLAIPLWVTLPDHSYVTGYNYTAPCSSV
jgi:hypothetical protein